MTFTLLENVVQIEDLKLPEFLHKIQNLATLDLKKSAKGMNFFFGVDEEGQLYSSKYGEEDKFYSTLRYTKEPDNNAFIGAHKFIFKFKQKLEKIIKPGEIIESKVQFFENTFDKVNKLVLMKGEHLSEIADLLDKKTLIRSQQTFSLEGNSTSTIERPSYWILSRQKKADVDLSGIKDEIEKLKTYLEKPCAVDEKMTNYELAQVNLGSIPMDKRAVYKTEREKINDYILTNFKLPIKNELLSKNDDMEIHGDDDETIEIKDNSILKNNFFLQAKHELSGIIRTSDPNAKLELRGGLYGEVLQRIATLFGIPEMANIQSAEKVFRGLQGDEAEDTAENFAKSLGTKNFYAIKTKLIAVFNNLHKDIGEKLDQFNHDADSYELKLSDDLTLKYTKDDKQANLDAFGAINDEIAHILHELKISHTMTDLVMIIFKRALELVHKDVVKESMSANYQSLTTHKICMAYMANYMVGLLLLRDKDKRAAALLRDSGGSVKKLNPHGSRLNFWGFLVFSSNYNEQSKKLLSDHVWKDMEKIAGRVIDGRIKFVHSNLSRTNNMTQDWEVHEETVKLFLMRLEAYESGIKDCLEVITNWEDASQSDMTITINKLFFYMQKHDPESPLFPCIKEMSKRKLINSRTTQNKPGVLDMAKPGLLKAVVEDASAGSTSAGATGGASTGSTTAGAVANLPVKLFRNKLIVRVPRTYEKKKKFKRPENLAAKGKDATDIDTFESIKEIERFANINLVWDDADCFKEGYEGYDYVRSEYGLAVKVFEAKTTWPEVNIIGSKLDITRFLKEQYGWSDTEIRKKLGE